MYITLNANQQKGPTMVINLYEEQNAFGPIVTVLNLLWGIDICQKQQDLVCGELEIHMM